MWSHNIKNQYAEDVQPDPMRRNPLNDKPLPVGKRLIVEVDFTNELGDSKPQRMVILPETGVPMEVTVARFIEQQKQKYFSDDESTQILENAKVIEEYLAGL